MKPAFERTPQRQWESFHCEVVRGGSYNATWHFHPEYQITLVLKSSGYRLVGDKLTPLRQGDLVLVGANLPHVWHQDEGLGRDSGVHAIVVRFLESFLGRQFLELPECKPVRKLLQRAARGLQIVGKTRDDISVQLEQLPGKKGLERVLGLLSILNRLAESTEVQPIASAGFVPKLSQEDQGRVGRVVNYIQEHLSETVSRQEVARQAHLSVGAFSRFFKLRTGKTLPQYVNELRVGRACQLLAHEELKVTDLAMQCGFRNLAHFNRAFREITRVTPREYRRQLARASA